MKRELNYKRVGVFALALILIIVFIVIGIKKAVNTSRLHKTIEYKLSVVGYKDSEIEVIKNKLNNEQIEKVLNSPYEKNLSLFLNEKYFIYKNLEEYLSLYKTNTNSSKVVALVNTGANKEFYSEIKKTDTSKGALMLVNKFYGLEEAYVPSDLVDVPGYYAYQGIKLSESIYDDFTSMLDAAREAGYTLLASYGYRSYADQKDAYDSIAFNSSERQADTIAARAGHSEFQTGLSVVVDSYGKEIDQTSDEYKWIKENSYKYGFIIRYPENTEDITGFETDYFRLRYVGKDVASKIHSENITFDEYYAYYIENR